MDHHIIVTFGSDQEYHFRVHDADTADLTQEQARQWLEQEYANLEPDLPSPLGKALLADKLLAIVKAYGQRPFASNTAWAKQFVRCAGKATGRTNVTINVATSVVGF